MTTYEQYLEAQATEPTKKVRPRKPATAARIEAGLWFRTEADYNRFAAVPFAPKAKTVTDREWQGAWLHPDGSVTARLVFTHTCRNSGAQRSDTERFFKTTCNAAGVAWWSDGAVMEVTLLHRDANVPQVDLVERFFTLGPEFYYDPRRNPDMAEVVESDSEGTS